MSTVAQARPRFRNPLRVLEDNFRQPVGWFGRMLGHVMTFQHKSLTRWTIGLMKVEPRDRVLDIGCGSGMAVTLVGRERERGFCRRPRLLEGDGRAGREAERGGGRARARY